MGNIKDKLNQNLASAKCELYTATTDLMNGNISKSDRVVAGMATFGSAILFGVTPVYGANIIDQIATQLKTYYGKIAGIATVVAAFCILIALLWTLISPSAQGASTPIGWIKKIVICWILILSIGGIVTLIESITSGMGYTP